MTTPDVLRDAEHIADISNLSYDDDNGEEFTPQQLQSRYRYRRETQTKTKTVLLNRLLRDFDILVYCQLSCLYYIDCSIVHFIIRAFVQIAFFSPKAGFHDYEYQPYIGAILISNLLCILPHFLSAPPAASEVSRGYLHGGLFIDFIGQKGPISKLQLIAFDILVVCLQIIMMGIRLESEKTAASLSRETSTSTLNARAEMSQDIDSEERGVHRLHSPGGDDIELQNLPSADVQNEPDIEEGNDQRRAFLSDSTTSTQPPLGQDNHARDEFLTGDAVIVEINVFRMIRDQWRRSREVEHAEPGDTATSLSPRFYFRRRFGMHFGTSV
ncbi:hypothetical protein LOZ57_003923 [Ophidiomyces ophidiicola]|uniref:uncharacterized protein n=1 Tax=Ophidiomyces ophidiicola TaxID=1387563 RepID=UPI0020C42CDE|nr:uncharacterized protein LOZ57_003923 [Ophidiomyces ophidiicola]KAI1946171.1 hypothetical protein LOZ57_003923 [Ophidiomyces ophidiicola]KAI2058240.1 hypothetical protein LOZ43_002707 [Ophidiomyces ophidiicola]